MRKQLRNSYWLIGLLLSSTILMACGQKGPLRNPEQTSQTVKVSK